MTRSYYQICISLFVDLLSGFFNQFKNILVTLHSRDTVANYFFFDHQHNFFKEISDEVGLTLINKHTFKQTF